jgi:Zn-dependent M28 family amino/carboxypeptidase
MAIGERHTRAPVNLEVAALYIEKVWRELGLTPRRQTFQVDGVACSNISVLLPGTEPEEVLFGAHYDSVEGCPGANDNGTGVAALLELTRTMLPRPRRRRLRLVAFVNEEPPYFDTPDMGSQVYAKAARARGDDIHAMVCLETLGAYDHAPGSQLYPPFYEMVAGEAGPDCGNFIAVVGNLDSAWLVEETAKGIIRSSDLPIETLVAWADVTGVDWSDHASFWRQGYPAVIVTDTAPYRYSQYHTPDDTPAVVNFGALAAVTDALGTVADGLLNRSRSRL